MIERIETVEAFNEWTKRDIFSVRILALLKSYGCSYNFCSFYRQIIDGKITALISKLDSDITLAVNGGFDNEELVRFLCLTGYSSLLCGELPVLSSRFDEGYVMKRVHNIDYTVSGAEIDEYPKLMDLFNFIDYNEHDFKSWYVDISHRVRHGTAKAYSLNINNEIVSSGILSSIYDKYAVLSAVRTSDEYRRRGYGSALVSAVCGDFKGCVYLMRDKGLNESFYTKLGFENCDKWRMYK